MYYNSKPIKKYNFVRKTVKNYNFIKKIKNNWCRQLEFRVTEIDEKIRLITQHICVDGCEWVGTYDFSHIQLLKPSPAFFWRPNAAIIKKCTLF